MKTFKLLLFSILLTLVALCSSAQNLVQTRIVSLIPSQTEMLFKLGFGDKVVGVSDYCNFPPETSKITKIGGLEINIEKVMALRPTLVLDLNSMHRRYELLFGQLGLNYVNMNINKLSDIPETAKQISTILGSATKGNEFVENWHKGMSEITLNSSDIEPKVYLEIWDQPMQAAGPTSFMGEMVTTAHGQNIITNQTDYPVVNSEHVIAADPDIILIAYPLTNLESIKNRPGWKNITAIRKNNIFALNQDLFVRPGPRNIDGLKELRRIFSNLK
jgi:iron complex transport system substrate-binding protein